MSNVKEFFKVWKGKELKKMDKDERTNLLYENIPTLVSYFIKKGHGDQDFVNQLFNRMQDEKFAKILLRILKTQDETPIEIGMAVIINEFLERRHDKIDEDTMDLYDSSIDKILKKKIKKVSKKVGLEKELLKDLLVIIPDIDVISDKKYAGIYVQKILKKIYVLSKENDLGIDSTKTLKKLFKALLGDDLLNKVSISILLERKEYIKNFNEKQTAVWNLLTAFALDTLEANKKKDIKSELSNYIYRRMKDAEKNRDGSRRVQLSQIASDSYPKIFDAVEDLSEKDKNKKYL